MTLGSTERQIDGTDVIYTRGGVPYKIETFFASYELLPDGRVLERWSDSFRRVVTPESMPATAYKRLFPAARG